MIWTLLVIVLIVVVGVSVLTYRSRSAKGIESGISSFRRELRALAPDSDEGPRAAPPPIDPPRTSGVGVLRDHPESRPGPGDGTDEEHGTRGRSERANDPEPGDDGSGDDGSGDDGPADGDSRDGIG